MSLAETLKFTMPREWVVVPGFAAPVWVRQMTAAQAEEHFAEVRETPSDTPTAVYTGFARLIARCLCDEQGVLLCQQDGVNQVLQLGTEAVVALYEACAKVNGMTKGAVEEAAKN